MPPPAAKPGVPLPEALRHCVGVAATEGEACPEVEGDSVALRVGLLLTLLVRLLEAHGVAVPQDERSKLAVAEGLPPPCEVLPQGVAEGVVERDGLPLAVGLTEFERVAQALGEEEDVPQGERE